MKSFFFERHCIDLAAARLGGKTLACSDDFFAPMQNLLKPGRGIFVEDKYTPQGKWMDGWESRRSYGRDNGRDFDWCMIRLGAPGRIQGFDIDTNHFRGNAPQSVSVDACDGDETPDGDTIWEVLLARTELTAHRQNLFESSNTRRWTHVRLNMFPDGGIARFRVYGEVSADARQFASGALIDLAALKNGAVAILCSDMFFSDKNNLLLPGRGINMGDGWETKRRRDPGPDWVIIRLAFEGCIRKVIIDTNHFKGNYPDRCSLHGIITDDQHITDDGLQWREIMPETKLQPDHEHILIDEIVSEPEQTFTHIRLRIFPDGGISRLRLFGLIKARGGAA